MMVDVVSICNISLNNVQNGLFNRGVPKSVLRSEYLYTRLLPGTIYFASVQVDFLNTFPDGHVGIFDNYWKYRNIFRPVVNFELSLYHGQSNFGKLFVIWTS